MVMKRNAMRRNLRNSILKSIGRYIAIAAIIALGSALFVGLLMTRTDMVATGQEYMDEQNMFDIRLVSTYGWAADQVEKTAQMDGIQSAEGVFYTDLIARFTDSQTEEVYRFYTLPETMNQVVLMAGRMPEIIGECLVDGYHADPGIIGKKIRLSANNEESSLEDMKTYLYTVVGYVSSPLYMDTNRGTTAVGSGKLAGFVYIPQDSVNADYYSEIHLKIPGNHEVYTKAYNDLLEDTMDAIEPAAEKLGRERFEAVKLEAEEEYQDGYQEYLDGIEEYEEAKTEAEGELADAYQELIDAEKEIEDTFSDLQNAERKLYKGRRELEKGKAELKSGKQQLEEGKAEAQANKPTLDSGKQQLESATGMSLSQIAAAPDKVKELEKKIERLNRKLQFEQDEQKRSELTAQLVSLQTEKATMSAISAYSDQAQQIIDGYDAINQIYEQEKVLRDTEKQLEEAEEEIRENLIKVYDGYEELEEAKTEVADGWEEYYEGKAEAEQELADAEEELAEAKVDLEEAREDIDDMEKPDVIILDRNSNVGYNNLDSASSIVQGVARVLPVFFLLIASLVCITTMTRMIEEERTQIGTLKALGYSNAAIISKYMLYAGTSAVIGCGLGVFLGSTAIPVILWKAYQTMLNIKPDVKLTVNLPLAIAVIAVYAAVILSVTWYSCRRTLEEVPAELLRPKSPDAGKALFLEKLPFWSKIGFLNKVTLRNIFRYRQRMLMMLVGIGGCTALLVTGYGLRDSIVNVVDYQFAEVTLYDMEVNFRDPLDDETKLEFLQELESDTDCLFYHQSSVDLEFDNRIKELYMLAADDTLTSYIHFHRGEEPVSMPGHNEVLLSVGVAENLGIHVGDRVEMRNADMKNLELTVSGIYDNHVENYAIILPETVESQWGYLPDQEMAMIKLPDGMEDHVISAKLMDLNEVMNVSVSTDRAKMVQDIMETMDMLIILIVFCAGLLAITVLYNLTNININERIREIATIKVLGFNASETASYVFKENMALTVTGSVIGLGLGYLLLMFVIAQIKIDMIWFKALVLPASYGYSIALTWLSALAVNFIFYFKLQKINMAEALKSVE